MTDQKKKTTDFSQTEKKIAVKKSFPASNIIDYRVFFTSDAYDAMKKHAHQTNEVELGGVLVGDVCFDDLGFYLNIVGSIEGKNANNYGTQVTFTHETWSHINEIKDRDYSKYKIVGWYHTHPGFGIFLSQMDSFIQDNFFNQPYQVAVVIETKRNQEGCFVWRSGECHPISKYWAGDQVVNLTTGDAEPFKPDTLATGSPLNSSRLNQYSIQPPSLSMNAILVIAILIICAWLVGKITGENNERSRMLDSEILSLIEFSAGRQLMVNDLQDIRSGLLSVKENATKTEAADSSKSIDELVTRVDAIVTDYLKDRSSYRKDLQTLANRKSVLNDEVRYNRENTERLERWIADLYLTRLTSYIGKPGAFIPESYKQNELDIIKIDVDRILSILPESKQLLMNIYPGLLEHFYPSLSQPKEEIKANDESH